MDENGLRAYIYRTNGQGEDGFNAVKEFDKYMKGDNFDYSRIDKNSVIDDPELGDKVKSYLAGKSDEAISELGQTYVTMGIDKLSDSSHDNHHFEFSSESYYKDNPNFFDKLTGEVSK